MTFKKRILTDSDLRIIDNHSKKHLSDTLNESDNANTTFHLNATGMQQEGNSDKS